MVDGGCKRRVATLRQRIVDTRHTTGAIAPTPLALVGALHMRLLFVSAWCSPLLDKVEV